MSFSSKCWIWPRRISRYRKRRNSAHRHKRSSRIVLFLFKKACKFSRLDTEWWNKSSWIHTHARCTNSSLFILFFYSCTALSVQKQPHSTQTLQESTEEYSIAHCLYNSITELLFSAVETDTDTQYAHTTLLFSLYSALHPPLRTHSTSFSLFFCLCLCSHHKSPVSCYDCKLTITF